ncbi:MAG: FAD-binding oxidoreductase, partial [Pseudomonadota bacterium]
MTNSLQATSYYQDMEDTGPQCPALGAEVTCGVCIIGAGFTGLSAAYELARAGKTVTVLDAQKNWGYGASSRNGGQVIVGWHHDIATMARTVGWEDAKHCWQLTLAGRDLIKERIARHEIACDLHFGYMHLAAKPRHLREMDQTLAEWQKLDYDHGTMIARENIQNYLASSVYCGGLEDKGSGHFHPLKYLFGLVRACIAMGVDIHLDNRATIYSADAPCHIVTPKGVVRSEYLIIAGNAYLDPPIAGISSYLIPVKSYIAATEPLGQRAQEIILQ